MSSAYARHHPSLPFSVSHSNVHIYAFRTYQQLLSTRSPKSVPALARPGIYPTSMPTSSRVLPRSYLLLATTHRRTSQMTTTNPKPPTRLSTRGSCRWSTSSCVRCRSTRRCRCRILSRLHTSSQWTFCMSPRRRSQGGWSSI